MKKFKFHFTGADGLPSYMVIPYERMSEAASAVGDSVRTGGFFILDHGTQAVAARAIIRIEEVSE